MTFNPQCPLCNGFGENHSRDCPAAAKVEDDGFCEECGATLPSHKRNCKTGSPVHAAIAAAIERCAQVAHDWLKYHGYEIEAIECAASTLALKDVKE